MASETESTESVEERRRRRAAAGTPIADEGDVAFGAMAGIAVLAAILVSVFAVGGFFQLNSGSGSGDQQAITDDHDNDDDADHDDGEEGDDNEDGDTDEDADGAEVDTSIDLIAANRQLVADGFGGVQLTLAPPNGIVATGEVPDDEARAQVISFLESSPNVEQVIDNLTVAEPEVSAAAANVEASDDSITLSGSVPSEDVAAQLRAVAASAYSANQITDELEVVDGADPFTLTASGTLTDPDTSRLLNAGLADVNQDFDNQLALDADAGAELTALFELEPVLFQANTNVILQPSESTLDRAAEILAAFPDATIEIGGHTDSRGPVDENLLLSQLRADAVEAALRDRGCQQPAGRGWLWRVAAEGRPRRHARKATSQPPNRIQNALMLVSAVASSLRRSCRASKLLRPSAASPLNGCAL